MPAHVPVRVTRLIFMMLTMIWAVDMRQPGAISRPPVHFLAQIFGACITLSSGANSATGHERISLGGYSTSSYYANKYGVRRFHKVVATSTTTTVRVSSLSASSATCSSSDLLDMAVYYKGTRVGLDEAASGSTSNCPSVTFCSTVGETYIVEVIGWGTVSSYDLNVSP